MTRLLASLLMLFSLNCLALEPEPSLSPQDVVTFQLSALQSNRNGEGIAATFRFASPANKRVTGPLSRFSQLFDNVHYRAMLNHRSAEVTQLNNDGLHAELVTEVIDQNGAIHHYRFMLSRQRTGTNINCWMTDSVAWEPQPGRSA